MIYTAQLYAGDWYILAETTAPEAANQAINALPCVIFPPHEERQARAAVARAKAWVAAGHWRIIGTDRKTRQQVTISEGRGCPRQMMSEACASGQYFGLYALPLERGADE